MAIFNNKSIIVSNLYLAIYVIHNKNKKVFTNHRALTLS